MSAHRKKWEVFAEIGSCSCAIAVYNLGLDFENFVEDLEGVIHKRDQKRTEANENYIEGVGQNVHQIQSTYKGIKKQMLTFDNDLVNVLAKHEQDFLNAYRLHMHKIEKELLALKNKSKDQDSKLTSDTRIITLEQQLVWFRNEYEGLLRQKKEQDEKLSGLRQEVGALSGETSRMASEVKAQRRINKLLAVKLAKVE